MKAIILLIIFFTINFFTPIFGQNVNGRVVDQNNQTPLAYANVVVLSLPDSVFLAGSITQEDGTFSLPISSISNCILRISFLGYQSWTAPVTKPDIGVIGLSVLTEDLSEVVVTGEKRIFKLEKGGIAADIQNSPLRNMGTLPDVLGQLPFVLKDQNSYTVFGKGSPIFYINNRLVQNNFELQQINSKDVKKVTVLTNPGAEYDASVNAVIKIETIRPVGEGLSAEIYTYNKYNKEWFTIDRISFNYQYKQLDIFGNIQYYNMAFPKNRTYLYQIETQEGPIRIISNRKDKDYMRFWTPQIGFNYLIKPDQALGIKYDYSRTYDQSGDYKGSVDVTKNEIPESTLHSDRKILTTSYAHYINAYYNGTIATWLTAQLDLDFKTTDRSNRSNSLNTREKNDIEKIITGEQSESELYAGKLTLMTPAWDGNWTYGAEGSYTRNKQLASVFEDSGVSGILPSNNRVTQKLVAGFVSYSKKIDRFSGDIGFRVEHVNSSYYQEDKLIEEQSKRYWNFFPNIRLSYNHDNLQVQLAYRNTISRPGYQELRGTIFYLAPFSYFSGNPLLQPTYKNSLTGTLMWKNLTFMSTYSHYKDRIVYMPQKYLENSILDRPINLNKSKQLDVSLNYSKTFGIWKPNWELSMTKDWIEYGVPVITYNKPVFYANFRNVFIWKGWQFGVDIRGTTSGYESAEYREKASWQTQVYINKSFFKEALQVNITGTDIFNTANDIYSYHANNVYTWGDYHMYRRSIIIGITYRFNATRNRYKGSRSTDELNRI